MLQAKAPVQTAGNAHCIEQVRCATHCIMQWPAITCPVADQLRPTIEQLANADLLIDYILSNFPIFTYTCALFFETLFHCVEVWPRLMTN